MTAGGSRTEADPLPRPHPGACLATVSTDAAATLRYVRAPRSGVILIIIRGSTLDADPGSTLRAD
jgi:hypothetical protein